MNKQPRLTDIQTHIQNLLQSKIVIFSDFIFTANKLNFISDIYRALTIIITE